MVRGVVAALLVLCCVAPVRAQDVAFEQFISSSRDVSDSFLQQLRRAMRKDMQRNGPESAMSICKNVSPVIAKNLAEEAGMEVRRVSHKPRNVATATPDAWEARVLEDFIQRAAKGEELGNIEFAEVVDEPQGKSYRYMKAMWTRAVCLDCHGSAERMREGVKAKLRMDYPQDKSIDFNVGDVVGGLSTRARL